MGAKWTVLSNETLTHPGERIRMQLELYQMTQKELAARIDKSEEHINRIIAGENPITPDVAVGLEKVFPLSATFWNRLQMKYDEEKTEIERISNL